MGNLASMSSGSGSSSSISSPAPMDVSTTTTTTATTTTQSNGAGCDEEKKTEKAKATVTPAQAPAPTAAAAPKDNDERIAIVSVSPQSITSLAERFDMPLLQTAQLVTSFFQRIGVRHVMSTACAQDMALLEAGEEFCRRYTEQKQQQLQQQQQKTQKLPQDATPKISTVTTTQRRRRHSSLPILSSECPGWICYAEKTQGEYILPYISAVKSPQQIQGVLIKRHLAAREQLLPNQVYHTTIMPCFDKKLEGARSVFFDPEHDTRDVDCGLTTSELYSMMQARAQMMHVLQRPNALSNVQLDETFALDAKRTRLLRPVDRGASGGYLENVMRYAAKRLFNIDVPNSSTALEYTAGKNADFKEVVLRRSSCSSSNSSDPGKDAVLLRFAVAYGFRNIQTIVKRIKLRKCTYDYVEIMACPSGCLNGGGQLKADSIKAQRALVAQLDELYHEEMVPRAPAQNEYVQQLYSKWIQGAVGGEAARRLLHTTYKAVPKLEDRNPLAIQW
jgi:iron only hydrogenase large subunit-like protein